MIPVGSTVIPVKKRLRFKEEDDLCLLREIVGSNPYKEPGLWQNIRENMLILTGKDFSIKTLKDHLDLMVKLWLERTKKLKDRSGIKEEYSEKDQLCQNIHDYMVEFRGKKNTKQCLTIKGKAERDKWAYFPSEDVSNSSGTNIAVSSVSEYKYEMEQQEVEPVEEELVEISRGNNDMRAQDCNDSMKARTPTSKVLRPNKGRKRRSNAQREGLAYLQEHDEIQQEMKKRDQDLEEKRLNIEEKKLALAEKKFHLEEYERKKTLDIMERRNIQNEESRHDLLKIIERQENLIQTLLGQIAKS